LERKNDIKHKYGKKISVIERFVINILWKEIISYLWVHTDARFNMGEKNIILMSATFQNLVHNSYNARYIMHLQVPPPKKSNRLGRLTSRIAR
jgi:hypothetical protein